MSEIYSAKNVDKLAALMLKGRSPHVEALLMGYKKDHVLEISKKAAERVKEQGRFEELSQWWQNYFTHADARESAKY